MWSCFRRFCSVSASVTRCRDYLELVVSPGSTKELYPVSWLRDNCLCENCFHSSSNSRIIDWVRFEPEKARIASVSVAESGLKLLWDDDHVSAFPLEWLRDRSFSRERQEEYLEQQYRPHRVLWDRSSLDSILKKFSFEDLVKREPVMLEWLQSLAIYGVALVQNASLDVAVSRKVAESAAFIRQTHYGQEFHVVSKAATSNVAYLSGALQMHTDLPYYKYKPGVILLHCIEQSRKGGENALCDGFSVAQKLRLENALYFKILSSVDVNWFDMGQEDGKKFHKIFRSPVICLNSRGEIERINHSVPQRDSHFTVPLEEVKNWYSAMKFYLNMVRQDAQIIKTRPGDILCIDNTRLLHGRYHYDDSPTNQRFLVGAYLDWDEIYSKLRVLKGSKMQRQP